MLIHFKEIIAIIVQCTRLFSVRAKMGLEKVMTRCIPLFNLWSIYNSV